MYRFLIFLSLVCLFSACQDQPVVSSFAIIIDSNSYAQATREVTDYAASIEKDGLKTIIIEDKWHHPDSIKETLIKLYHDPVHPLEGAVFIGDIPIAMIRDAQHFTSAFKMNQKRFDWARSSVPSDRFYDDFDLSFEYLKKDTENKLYHYYSLKTESTQHLQPEIYTGRIKPFESEHKYEDLKKYLKKVVRLKSESNVVDQVLFFGGHGYNSESTIARMDEKITLLDQFPGLNKQTNGLNYIDHGMETHIKSRLMSEVQRKDLDIALLHHHGGDDTQYLSGMPKVDGVSLQIDGTKRYLRSKLRNAKRRGKSIQDVKRYYHKSLNVPLNWFDGTFDPAVIKEDSIFNASLDIVIEDVMNYKPSARLVILDACFNGSFHLDRCLASTYIFNDGNTVAVQANSVNTLQDKWANELIGLLGLGVRFGNWSKHVSYLETHIIGDPTFRFKTNEDVFDVNQALIQHGKDAAFWRAQLSSDYCAIRTLALRKLFENNYPELSNLLLHTFKQSKYGTVRMECLKLLTAFNDDNFIECLSLACNDSYELVRRQAIYLIGKSGDDRLIEPLLTVAMRNNASARVEFNAKQALTLFEKDKLMAHFDRLFADNTSFTDSELVKSKIVDAIAYNTNRWKESGVKLLDPEISDKEATFSIRSLRNYNYHPGIENYCRFVRNSNNQNLQVMMLEALGWLNISCKKDVIVEMCKEVVADDHYPACVREQAQKTSNRLLTPWYR
ncbi:HEAT repeat domain-containing protein [Marinilabiliaceae bacterium JC017]|nr:HEAT repeat domain-containing protein [Marinilabiliaceae bacterium JC017]